jgi:hypothetical protein
MAMSGSIVAINNSIHDKVQELLPWFVVDTLTGDELELVNQHLNVCAECQADFAWQCKLQATEPVGDANPDVDAAFSRLRSRLDETLQEASQRTPAGMAGRSLPGTHPWMKWALAAQFAAIVGLVGLLATLNDKVAAYRALGAGQSSVGNLVVVFKPETSERELRRILQNAGARIVDGPTVTDAYLLSVPDNRLAVAIRDLRADGAVMVAESLSSMGKR